MAYALILLHRVLANHMKGQADGQQGGSGRGGSGRGGRPRAGLGEGFFGGVLEHRDKVLGLQPTGPGQAAVVALLGPIMRIYKSCHQVCATCLLRLDTF